MFDQRKAYFITKCDGQLLQIATAFSLQSATRFITSCDRYYMPDGFISGAPRAREARARGRSPIAK